MFDPLGFIPDDWKTVVTRVVGAGRDSSGNWVPGVDVTVTGCVLAPGTTDEDGAFSDITSSELRLFAPLDPEAYSDREPQWTSGDTVITPPDSIVPGSWHVQGKPVRWPAGWEIRLAGEGGRRGLQDG